MSQNIQRFGVDQVGDTRQTTHYSESPLSLGLGVALQSHDTLVLADGNKAYGIVMQCDAIGSHLYLVTVCTLAERIAVRLKDGEKPADTDPLTFSQGELVASADGTYYLQEIDESTLIEDGSTKRAAQIRFA